MPPEEYEQHKKECQMRECNCCGWARIPSQWFEKHFAKCQEKYRQCPLCRKFKQPLSQLAAHIETCSGKGRVRKRTRSTVWTPRWSGQKPVEWLKAMKDNGEKLSLSRKMRSLLEDRPQNVMLLDFEYNVMALSDAGHRAIYEIAVMDGTGQWVVEPSVIDHQMTRGELAKVISRKLLTHGYPDWRIANESAITKNSLAKFYPGEITDRTPGKTWGEIGSMWRATM